ncbi:MAG: universal stress protein [Rivularia sp. (in: Bacteria)]|nr:universal stress protein [Rivularia sp. MS3]
MWQRILVATDGTELARIAVDEAIALAALTQAQLFGIFVVDPVDFDEDIAEQMLQTGQSERQRFEQAAKVQNVPVQFELKTGEPVVEILSMAKTVKAELIVVAPHHRSSFYHLLIQKSVTNRLVEQAKQSIWIVNPA